MFKGNCVDWAIIIGGGIYLSEKIMKIERREWYDYGKKIIRICPEDLSAKISNILIRAVFTIIGYNELHETTRKGLK
jgi:hypothetical protein